MFISHKSNVLQQVHETEWQCRRKTKGQSKPEYWAWLESVTSGDPPEADFSSETGYTIVECTDEDVQARLVQLDDYVSNELEGTTYNIKYYASTRDAEEIKDIDGNSHDPKQYVQSHFVPQDDTRDARLLADEWTRIRTERNRLLTDSDWVVVKAKEEHPNASIPSDCVDYRTELRDITKQSDPDDITWPTKP